MEKSGQKPIHLAKPIIDTEGCCLTGNVEGLVEVFQVVFDNAYSGIILCDKNSRILYMNKFYADLLRTNSYEAVGQHIKKFFPSSRLPGVLETGRMELRRRCSLRSDLELLVNRIPIVSNGEAVGVVLQTVFKNYAEIHELMNRMSQLENKVNYYKRGLDSVLTANYSFDSIIGRSPRLLEAKAMAAKYAETDGSVLILGATGTGKELFAHAVHMASPRSQEAFACVNCAAIPKELIESELFGYETGAFTGASPKGKSGKIQLAEGGTLFLDEIGDLPLSAQAKLLRVLETKEIEKLGGLKKLKIDFRLVAATNKDLRSMISCAEFREDLFYRLNTMCVEIPALAERPEDIPVLISHFLYAMGRPLMRIGDRAMRLLESYSWPGNVRELKNAIQRAVSLADGMIVHREHLPYEIRSFDSGRRNQGPVKVLSKEVGLFEKNIISEVLSRAGGNMSRTARLLGISRSTLYEKCRAYDIRYS
ncbi:MAG: sigma 54-interacting transcriptional regulator [Desulfatiglandaceae bacterium]